MIFDSSSPFFIHRSQARGWASTHWVLLILWFSDSGRTPSLAHGQISGITFTLILCAPPPFQPFCSFLFPSSTLSNAPAGAEGKTPSNDQGLKRKHAGTHAYDDPLCAAAQCVIRQSDTSAQDLLFEVPGFPPCSSGSTCAQIVAGTSSELSCFVVSNEIDCYVYNSTFAVQVPSTNSAPTVTIPPGPFSIHTMNLIRQGKNSRGLTLHDWPAA